MAATTAPENMWVKFFNDAGLPSTISATYALTFAENRIQMNMLLDLNKEYLREMGIVCMGDVIAILRHAKQVHDENARSRFLRNHTSPQITPKSEQKVDNIKAKPPPPDTGIIKERLGDLRKMATKRKISYANDSNAEDVRPVQIERKISEPIEEIPRKIIRLKPTPSKISNVFKRLGDSEPAPKTNTADNHNVFARLGDKGSTPKVQITNESSLKQRPKKLVIESNGSVRTLNSSGTMHADKITFTVKQKLSEPPKKSVKFSPHVDCKVIERSTVEKKPNLSNVILSHIKPPLVRSIKRINVNAKNNVKMRLGGNKTLKTVQPGVFSRLGLASKQRIA